MLRRSINLALALACAAAMPLSAQAQSTAPFPSKPIRIVASAAPGGANDFVARTVGERLAKALGQPVVVDNKAGANGGLGAAEVARAAPDGYTLLVTLGDTLINNTAMYKSLAYDPFKDFAYITQAVRSPAVISVNPEVLPAKNMADLRTLNLSQTEISQFPDGLLERSNLTLADLSDNQIQALPEALFSLPADRAGAVLPGPCCNE